MLNEIYATDARLIKYAWFVDEAHSDGEPVAFAGVLADGGPDEPENFAAAEGKAQIIQSAKPTEALHHTVDM